MKTSYDERRKKEQGKSPIPSRPGCSRDASTLTFHFEAAQEAYKEALRYLKREADPQLWAATQVEVGGTQAELGIRGEGKAANEHLTDAITAYRNALEVYTRERLPQDWAAVQTNLGNALQAQGLRTGVLRAMICWPKRWPPTAAPWRCIRPKASPLTTSEWRRIWRKATPT